MLRRTPLLLTTFALAACASPPSVNDAGDARADAPSTTDVAMDAPRDASAAPDAIADVATDAGLASDAAGDAASDAAPDAPIDSGPRCAAGTDNCGGTCVDLQADTSNCGMCGNACPAGQGCNSGTCGCPMDRTLCGAACVDTQADSLNCGACGNACPMGQMCVMGACRIDCPAPGTICTSGATMSCVDTSSSVANCGMCGRACSSANAAATCSMGACGLGVCNAGFANCDAMAANGCEVDTRTSAAHCGACGAACVLPNATPRCTAGACAVAACNAGFADCDGIAANGCESNTNTSAASCGACGRACAAGQTCSMGACVGGLGGTVFQLSGLPAASCRLVEHVAATGDDRGGIAFSPAQVFYTGDNSTGRFSTADVTGGAAVGAVYDALFNDLATQTAYAFGTAAGPFRASFGGTTVTIDRFFRLDPSTGAAGAATLLSSSFTFNDTFSATQGIFSGMGRVVVLTAGRALDIALPTGTVADRGAFTLPPHQSCENHAVWGVAEFFGGALYVTYVQSNTTIARTAISSLGAMTQTVASFTNLSDMCSFTVSPAQNKWFWHHEGVSQFGGSDESVGFCSLTVRTCRDAQLSGGVTSGVYMLDPDGAGPVGPQSVYCDQSTDGGGWALVGRIGDPRFLPFLDTTMVAITAPGGMGNALHPAYASMTGTAVRVGRHVASGTNAGNFFQINDCTAGDAACWYGSYIAQNDGDMYGAWLGAGGAWRSVPAGCVDDQCPTLGGERDQPGPQRIAIFGGDCHVNCNTDGNDTRNGFVYRDYGTSAMPSRIGNRAWWGAGTVTAGSTALGSPELTGIDYGQSGTQWRDLWIR